MGAAQNKRVDPGGAKGREVFCRNGFDDRIAGAEPPVFHQRHEQGARLGVHLNVAVQRGQAPLVGTGSDGGGGGDKPHLLVPGDLRRRGASGLHHAQNGDVALRRQNRQSVGGHGAARHQQRLHIEGAEEADILPRIAEKYLRRASAVGDTGRVSEVYNVLRGEDAAYLPHGGEPAETGVEHPDGSLIHENLPP